MLEFIILLPTGLLALLFFGFGWFSSSSCVIVSIDLLSNILWLCIIIIYFIIHLLVLSNVSNFYYTCLLHFNTSWYINVMDLSCDWNFWYPDINLMFSSSIPYRDISSRLCYFLELFGKGYVMSLLLGFSFWPS